MKNSDHVTIHGSGIKVDRVARDVPSAEARQAFGGNDATAVLGGGLAGLGTIAVLAALAAAGLAELYKHGTGGRNSLALTGYVAALVILGLAGLAAGWFAGRISRYDGGRNGVPAALLAIALTVGVGALARWQHQVFDTSVLPSWVRDDVTSYRALLIGIAGTLLALALGALGGKAGGHWHRKADDLLLSTRDGGLPLAEPVLEPYPSPVDTAAVRTV